MKIWNENDYGDRLTKLSDRARMAPDRGWFIIRTNPRCEMLAFDGLERAGFEPWMPMGRQHRRRTYTKNRRAVLHPVLTGYLFARVPLKAGVLDLVRAVQGVRDVLGKEDRGVGVKPVPTDEIERYQRFSESGVFDERRAKAHWRKGLGRSAEVYKPGDEVRVKDGPYAGIVVRFDGYERGEAARVLAEVFGALRPVEISLAAISANI